MANEFTLAGTFKDASNSPAYVGQYVVFRVTSVGTDTEDQVAYPRDSVSFLIDANGDFGGTMWLNGDSGTVCLYEILDPSGQRIEVIIPSSEEGATVRYEQIIENYQAGSASPQLPANEVLFMRKANNLSDVSSVSTSRANLGLEIGTDVQAHSSILDATTVSFTASKDTEISANTANIATNAGDIATNTADIATNAADIADKAPIASPTFTGTATIPQADITSADFNSAGVGGELSWNDGEKTIDLTTGSDNVTVQLGQEVVLYVRNTTGSTLSNGQVVMVIGSQGNKPTISLAQADTVANARKTIGVLTQDIPNNSNGFITLIGKVRDLVLDDATYSEGDVVFLSSTVAGGITLVEPDISVEIGHVLATSSGGNTNGVIEVQINNGADLYNAQSQIDTNTAAIATKAPIASPTFTGDLTVGSIEIGQSSSSTVVDLLNSSNESGARTSVGLGATDTVEFGALIPPAGTTAEIDSVTNATAGQVMIDTDRRRQVRFTGLSSYVDLYSTTSTVEVGAYGNAVENGNSFKNAYTSAKALTPNGSALSSTNRAVLILGAGQYDLGGSAFTIDGEFVDIVVAANLLSHPESLITKQIAVFTNGNFDVTANDVLIYGLNGDGTMNAAINSSKPLQVWQSCSFAGGPSFSPYADGVFINCYGSSRCFGNDEGGGSSAGTFIDCVSVGLDTFGGGGVDAEGTYIRCKSKSVGVAGGPFGSGADASGYFEDCEAATDGSFGGYDGGSIGVASGTFVRCKGTGNFSFAGFSTFSGTAKNCESGTNGFATSGTLTGTLLWCQNGSSFATVSGAGKTRMCLDGTLTENNQG